MADKLKISKNSSDVLNHLSSRLNLRRNVVCRLALSTSLSTQMPVETKIMDDTDGYEFNKSTILGPDEVLFKSLASFVQKEQSDHDFFNIIIRNHIEKGLDIMYNEFQTINSPTSFLKQILD